jgi:acetolactate decarboxylase
MKQLKSCFTKYLVSTAIATVLVASAQATTGATKTGAAKKPTSLYVYSTIEALLGGAYDGDLTVQELKKHGDFGLGTYNHLDGEMVVFDGVFYHVKADGTIDVAKPTDKVPLAFVLPFKPHEKFILKQEGEANMAAMERQLDERLSDKNVFHAVKITGEFSNLSTRAIAPQVRPYKPLAEVSKTQVVFQRETVRGAMIGLRSPAFSKGISVPGWHWHFVSDDKKFGGHVLSGALIAAQVEVAAVRAMDVELPQTADFSAPDQTKDRPKELRPAGDRK